MRSVSAKTETETIGSNDKIYATSDGNIPGVVTRAWAKDNLLSIEDFNAGQEGDSGEITNVK